MKFSRKLATIILSLLLSFSISAQCNDRAAQITAVETLCTGISDIYESSGERAQRSMRELFEELRCQEMGISGMDNISALSTIEETPARYEGYRPEQRTGSFCETPTGACTVVTQRINSLCKCGDSYGRIVR